MLVVSYMRFEAVEPNIKTTWITGSGRDQLGVLIDNIDICLLSLLLVPLVWVVLEFTKQKFCSFLLRESLSEGQKFSEQVLRRGFSCKPVGG